MSPELEPFLEIGRLKEVVRRLEKEKSMPALLSPFPPETTRRMLVKSLAVAESVLVEAKEKAADSAQIVRLAEEARQDIIDALCAVADQ